MKDFDQERRERHARREEELPDRRFVLNGHTFTYRANPSYTALERLASASDAQGVEVIRLWEDGLLDLLDDGQEDALLAALRDPKKPVTIEDLNQIISWVTEAQTARPTSPPSPSGAGGNGTSTSSTEDSSSVQVEGSAI